MRVLVCILIAFTLESVARGQSTAAIAGTFKITQTNPVISTSTISGKESYQITATAQGYTIKSNLWVAEGETPVLAEVEEKLRPDWSLDHYTFNGVVAGIHQEIEAWMDGSQAQMQFTAEGTSPHRTIHLKPNTVVLDNFVPTNFQVLLNRFAASAANGTEANSKEVYLLVPQRLFGVKATLERSGRENVLLQGKQIEATKYTLQMASGPAHIWADDQNHLLGVYFDAGDIEYLNSGVELPQLKLAMARTLPREHAISFKSDGRQLLGTLMLPPENLDNQEEYPLVVMAGGFGPVDRDGTIGKNKPMRDLALGLAYKGIASLRYDKPSYSFHGRTDTSRLTIDSEAIHAAADALGYAHTLSGIDRANIFFLGYSEGGEVAPFVLQRSPDVRGAIIMAAPARSPEEFVPGQLAAGLKMRGTPEDEIEAQVSALKKQFADIKNGTLPNTSEVLGYSAGYWRSLMALNILQAAHNTRTPVLLLQGDRDRQASKQDYELLRAAIPADSLDARYFVGLNHIFMPAPEGSNGSEMLIGSRIADPVIGAITTWIEKKTTGNGDKLQAARDGHAKE